MSAIEACRTEALGGHVAGCTKCGHHHIAYNYCKNRHCPKCQGPAARDWMEARAEDLLPVEYFHVVFTLPAEIARIACWNKRAVYGLLFKSSAQTVMTIAADPRRMGARVGMTSMLHTWGSALTHHPHVHMIVPGGGLSPGGSRWIACSPGQDGLRLPSPARPRGCIRPQSLRAFGAISGRIGRQTRYQPPPEPTVAPSVRALSP